MEHLRAGAVGAGGIGAQYGGKRRVVEVAIPSLFKNAVAGQKPERPVERWLMSFGGAGEVCHRLRLAGLDVVGKADLGNGADRAAEGGTGQDASEFFSFLLAHGF